MEYIILKIDSPEWTEMWNWLAEHPINEGLENPKDATNGEYKWEYMGSFKKGNDLVSDIHHRQHPTTNESYTLSYSHKLLTDDSIEHSKKIK